MSKVLEIQLLGDLTIYYGGMPVMTVQSPQEQSLLAYVLLHRSAPQSRQHLSFVFWPDATEAQARNHLRRLLFRLRQDLPNADRFLYTDAQTIKWQADAPFALDVAAFERALDDASQKQMAGHLADACRSLSAAVELYRGDLVPSCYDDWILSERMRLSRQFVRALETLLEVLEAQRAYDLAISHALRLTRYDPLHEPAYRTLMRLYASTGNRASALRVFHGCATELQRELGVQPSPETRQVYERLLRLESLDAAEIRLAEGENISSLVGRQREWTDLLTSWREAVAGTPQLVLLEGEAGIGKTRLGEELVRSARQTGTPAAVARCYAAEGELAYGPVVQWLRALPLTSLDMVWHQELMRLLPELRSAQPDLVSPGSVSEPWQRQRLFEALAHAVLDRGTPVLLFIDDLQWSDPETLEWLHYLLRFDKSAKLLVIGTLRRDELASDHWISSWLRAVQRTVSMRKLVLGPLDEATTLVLARNMSGQEIGPHLASCIYAETEGNPLFIVEMVRAGIVDRSEATCPLQGLPPRVQATIEGRLARLSHVAQEVVAVAATIGREVTLPVLMAASDVEQDDLFRALDEVWRRRILREQGGEGYDFGHDKLRQVAYARLGEARRRALHLRVAQSLEMVHATDLDAFRGQVAAHYDRAGHAARAIPHYLHVAKGAQRVYANQAAIDSYQRILTLVHSVSQGNRAQWQLRAHSGLGQMYLRIGKPDQAKEQLHKAIALSREYELSARHSARLYYWLGQALYWQARYEEQVRVGEEGLALLDEDRQSVEAALILDTIATGYDYSGNREKSSQLWHEIAAFVQDLPYVEELGVLYRRVHILYVRNKEVDKAAEWLSDLEGKIAPQRDERALGMIHQRRADTAAREGDLRGAVAHLAEALECALHTGNAIDHAFYVWRRGFRSLALGDLTSAEDYARTALDLDRLIDSDLYLAWGYWLLGLVLLCRGDHERGMKELDRSIEVADHAGLLETVLWSHHLLGRAWLDRGDATAAAKHYREATAMSCPDVFRNWRARELRPYALVFVGVLGGLEESLADDSVFRSFCQDFPNRASFVSGAARSHPLAQFALSQWFLKPVTPSELAEVLLQEPFEHPLSDAWKWIDPFNDCAYTVGNGLELDAANGRGLWHINWSAPRLLRPLASILADPTSLLPEWGLSIQAVCVPIREKGPAMGGLLLWIDRANYLRLDLGSVGPREVLLTGCVENQELVIGRGHLRPEDELQNGIHLRMDWAGSQVLALCSIDGQSWYKVGQTKFPPAPSAQVGLYASGDIDRTIYQGAYPDGTALLFVSFQCARLADRSR